MTTCWTARLVCTLEGWYSLAFVLVESVACDRTVSEFDFAVRLLLPGQGVLHPVHVVPVGVIFASMSTTGLFTVRCCFSGLYTVNKLLERILFSSQPQGKLMVRTRKSTSFSAPMSRQGQSSKSYCDPLC